MINPIYPCLWFDGQSQSAADFYCSVFPNSKILSANPMAVIFELNGQKFMGLNGGPEYKFNEAISFVVNCETQEEIIRDATDAEIAQMVKDKAEADARLAEAEAKAQAKAAAEGKLAALGLTTDDLRALGL